MWGRGVGMVVEVYGDLGWGCYVRQPRSEFFHASCELASRLGELCDDSLL